MKRTGYAENGMLGGTYGTWMAVVMNLAAAAMMGVFVYDLRVW